MIEILPANGEGITDNSVILEAAENGSSLGSIAFEFMGDTLRILQIAASEPWLVDALVKSALAYGENRGVIEAWAEQSELEQELLGAGFEKTAQGLIYEAGKRKSCF
ncbi:MAG: hypothetical protein LBS74_09750 [Oscillospiraceae bacterium]|jgi:hypothetical protein|nr:hypothetical protein [Oscillospiraceae bacterium]